MAGPFITTKLHSPVRRSANVSRARLVDRMATPAKLTLVAAPAGFGKTSLVSEWLSTLGDEVHVAWFSVDDRDNDAARFWTYVITALDRADPGVGETALEMLRSASAQVEAALAALINDLDARPTKTVLVLDDFHVIESAPIQSELAFFVDNLPPTVRLVMSTRADPPLPLARLRARGQLVEIRAADLRFTAEEAATYVNDVMGLAVAHDDVVTLSNRTEGWIAAIQLAALSMQGRNDPAAFIAGFAGDDRYVVDYLVEEVLQRQPATIRQFLLDTSILPRLTGELCDAVTGASGGGGTLEALDRANLFLVSLDDQREWYRYHHLFADTLRGRLLDESPEHVTALHRRASAWFERQGDTTDAIDHAITAGDFDRAADMIVAAIPRMQQLRQESTAVGWFDLLPPHVISSRPDLSVAFAGALLLAGRTESTEVLLYDAESGIGGTTERTATVRNGIALYRAAQALSTGDTPVALEQTHLALKLAADRRPIDRGSAAGLLGLILWGQGDLEAAHRSWSTSLGELQRAGHVSDTLGGSIAVADILITQGKLVAAHETYQRALDVATASDPPLRGAADMHVGLAELFRERHDLASARRSLAAAEALGEYAGLPQNRHRRRIATARLLQAEGEAAAATPLLDEAERVYTPDFFPNIRPIAALRARLQLAAGHTADAQAWADRSGLTADDELSYMREYEHITLARVLAAEPLDAASTSHAQRLLGRLLQAATDGGRGGVVIELLVLQAVTSHRLGDTEAGLTSLARAVERAEPEGFVRVFADEGEPMAHLLALLVKRRTATNSYLRRLRSATSGNRGRHTATQDLVDPLSERELSVLRLLEGDMGGPEISRHLSVSLNTLRTHTKNIYAKLGVTSRRAAVRKATELGLL